MSNNNDKYEAFTTKVNKLSNVTDPKIQEERSKKLLASLPTVESCADAGSKVQVLVLRGRVKHMIPSMEKEAESDISKALKLRSNDRAAWLALSEILWKKGSLREARDAAESAVRAAPSDVDALCKASRLARCVSVKENNSEKKAKLLAESIARAKQALAGSPKCSEAWLALALALFNEACFTIMIRSTLKKALAAVTQACRCATADENEASASKKKEGGENKKQEGGNNKKEEEVEDDDNNQNDILVRAADAWINRGLIEHALCMFGDASASFERALVRDSSLSQQVSISSKRSQAMLTLLQQRTRLNTPEMRSKHFGNEWKEIIKAFQTGSLEKKAPKGFNVVSEMSSLHSLFNPVAAASEEEEQKEGNNNNKKKGSGGKAVCVVVLRLVSGPSDMPLVYEAIDKDGSLCCLSISNLNPQAIITPSSSSSSSSSSTTSSSTTAASGGGGGGSGNNNNNNNNNNKYTSVTIIAPPAEQQVVEQMPSPQAGVARTTMEEKIEKLQVAPLHCIFSDARNILINGSPVPNQHIIGASVSVQAL